MRCVRGEGVYEEGGMCVRDVIGGVCVCMRREGCV